MPNGTAPVNTAPAETPDLWRVIQALKDADFGGDISNCTITIHVDGTGRPQQILQNRSAYVRRTGKE